jgi:hypothetical protein
MLILSDAEHLLSVIGVFDGAVQQAGDRGVLAAAVLEGERAATDIRWAR